MGWCFECIRVLWLHVEREWLHVERERERGRGGEGEKRQVDKEKRVNKSE